MKRLEIAATLPLEYQLVRMVPMVHVAAASVCHMTARW